MARWDTGRGAGGAAERLRGRQGWGQSALPLDHPFRRALEGMPPASGVALGLDRLIMLVTSTQRMDDVVAF